MTPTHTQSNQLVNASSPYLLQHMGNPVHWREWNEDSLAEARRTGKPILLSVGYAACHWCHVMAHESFEDENIAAIMNKLYINIKVDREERPDIDQIYMESLHAMGEQGGWPLTMFLTPDAEPFWGGTYFPPTPSYGRPAFKQVLEAIERTYREQAETIAKNTGALKSHLQNLSAPPANNNGLPPTNYFTQFVERSLSIFDPINGGTQGAPKFPNAPMLESWARAGSSGASPSAQDAFLTTVTSISNGGIYDHLRGGIARYSVDENWLAPHFEKMLYDNAHFVRHLTHAWKLTGHELFRIRINETLDWLIEEMVTEEGAFASSLDADSEGEEGKFYVWTKQEIESVLGSKAEEFCNFYDVTHAGNWEGKTILNRLRENRPGTITPTSIQNSKIILLGHRNKRISPGRDDKVLTDWNAYMIRSIAEAGRAFSQSKWIDIAKDVFHSLSKANIYDGVLVHSSRLGVAAKSGLASDYSAMINAALSLYEATSDPAYLNWSRKWKDKLDQDYSDGEGGYYLTSKDASDLIVRPRCDTDEANPSAASLILEGLIRHSHLANDADVLNAVDKLAANLYSISKKRPYGMAGFANAVHSLHNHKHVLINSKSDKDASAFVKEVNLHPSLCLTVSLKDQDDSKNHLGLKTVQSGSESNAIICNNKTCSAPISNPVELKKALNNE